MKKAEEGAGDGSSEERGGAQAHLAEEQGRRQGRLREELLRRTDELQAPVVQLSHLGAAAATSAASAG